MVKGRNQKVTFTSKYEPQYQVQSRATPCPKVFLLSKLGIKWVHHIYRNQFHSPDTLSYIESVYHTLNRVSPQKKIDI